MKKQELLNLIDETLKELDGYDINYRGMIICQKHAITCQKARLRKEIELEALTKINLIKQMKELNLLKKKEI